MVAGVRLTGDGVLQIVGTGGRDHIIVSANGGDELRVNAHFDLGETTPQGDGHVFSFAANAVHSIHAVLCAGDDHLNIHQSIAINAWADGGAGDDHLTTGSGADVILGDAGKDVIHAGAGGQEDERDGCQPGILCHQSAQLKTVGWRHHDVRKDQVGKAFPGLLQAIPAVTGSENLVPLAFHFGRQAQTQGRLIVNDQYGGGLCVHAITSIRNFQCEAGYALYPSISQQSWDCYLRT